MSDKSYIKNNLREIELKVASRASIIVVSKTFPVEDIKIAYDYGIRNFAENRVQELDSKIKHLPSDIRWHLIGHLQRNKVSKAVDMAYMIHSVDSEDLIERIDRIAREKGKIQKILLEVKLSSDESKTGVNPNDLRNCIKVALSCRNIELLGLMSIPSLSAEEKEIRTVFSTLVKIRDAMELDFNIKLPELSMGMSSDYEIAIEEGSTIVRVGSIIFGKREV